MTYLVGYRKFSFVRIISIYVLISILTLFLIYRYYQNLCHRNENNRLWL